MITGEQPPPPTATATSTPISTPTLKLPETPTPSPTPTPEATTTPRYESLEEVPNYRSLSQEAVKAIITSYEKYEKGQAELNPTFCTSYQSMFSSCLPAGRLKMIL